MKFNHLSLIKSNDSENIPIRNRKNTKKYFLIVYKEILQLYLLSEGDKINYTC